MKMGLIDWIFGLYYIVVLIIFGYAVYKDDKGGVKEVNIPAWANKMWVKVLLVILLLTFVLGFILFFLYQSAGIGWL